MLICIALMGLQAMAQKEIVSGTVTDARTGRKLTQASVTVKGEGVSVVTNDDGYFTLKTDTKPDYILVSHLGYETKEVRVENDKNTLRIRLKPTTIELRELVVWTEDPRELVRIAIRKIPSNYSKLPELYNCFYRETAMKRNHFIYVAEGVTDMYKTAYSHGMARDRVAIRKGRRLLSRKESDTLGVKVMGGPVQPLQLDIAKNTDFLLNAEELENYKMTMEVPTQIDGRLQYVVSLAPCRTVDYALYYGKLYIDPGLHPCRADARHERPRQGHQFHADEEAYWRAFQAQRAELPCRLPLRGWCDPLELYPQHVPLQLRLEETPVLHLVHCHLRDGSDRQVAHRRAPHLRPRLLRLERLFLRPCGIFPRS